MNEQTKIDHAVSPSLSTAGLAETRSRKDALWRVFTSQETSHMAGTMLLLDKNGLVFFNKELYPAKWRLTDKGRGFLFAWSPDLAEAANVK